MATELHIDENWIKERINLKEDVLEDVKTLSLPGTYQEKITHLGTALQHFTRLKELDLSRNAIESLDGLQNQVCLEKLNLYYNAVSTLNEIYKLRSNCCLEDLDLRLNPVARNEPDYRLFVIHMLPSLKKLDDRSIRDQERKAALMHFGTDQASEFCPPNQSGHSDNPPPSSHRTGSSANHPRAQHIERMRPGGGNNGVLAAAGIPPFGGDTRAFMDEDGNENMDDGVPLAPRGVPPVSGKRRSGDNNGHTGYSAEEYGHKGHARKSSKERLQVERRVDQGYQSKDMTYDNSIMSGRGSSHPYPNGPPSAPSRGTPSGTERGQAHFTPHPSSMEDTGIVSQNNHASSVLSRLCDLVDRYWNGSKSLHAHPRFQPSAQTILAELSSSGGGSFPSSAETDKLRARIRQLESQGGGDEPMRERLRMSQEDNRQLQKKIAELELSQKVTGNGFKDKSSSLTTGNYGNEDVERLKMEISTMKVQLKTYEQMSELANMLKESHKSLVTTNDHLMRELAENRDRHQREINQMRWSYDQLKRTYDTNGAIGGHSGAHGQHGHTPNNEYYTNGK